MKLIYQKTLTKAIKAGQIDSLDIKEDKLLGWIDNDFQIYLKNFSTPGTSSLAGYDLSKPLKIVFKLIVLRINTVELSQGKIYELGDKSDLRLDEGGDIGVEYANYNLYLKNGFPADYILQAYFLDSMSKKVDSLIKGSTIIASPGIEWKDSLGRKSTSDASVGDVKGYVLQSVIVERTFSTRWTKEEYDVLKKKVRYLRTVATLKTPGIDGNRPPVNLVHENKIGVILTGKFEINYKLSND
jgi:hypothetical protein